MNKSTEEALYESQARLAGIIDSAMDAIITVDEEQRVLVFNRAAERMFHCSAVEALGQSLDRFIPKRFRPSHSSHIQSFGKTGITTRALAVTRPVYGLRANGEEFPVEASISQVEAGGQRLYTVIMRDVTERQQAQEKLMRMLTAVEPTGESIIITDVKGIIQYVNPGFEHTTGYDSEEVIGKHTRILKGGLASSEYYQDLWNAISSGHQWTGHFTNKKKDGTLYEEEATISPVRDLSGSITGYVAVKRDVTERMRAEEALKASEAEMRALFAAMSDVILVLDAKGRYLKIAPTDPVYLYKPHASLLGKKLHEVFPKEQADFFLEHIHRSLDEGRTHQVEYSMQLEEKEVWFDGSVSPMNDNSVIWIARDITERKQADIEKTRAQEALRESEERYKGLVDSAFDGVVIMRNRIIKSANRSYAEMFGYTPEELVGMDVLQLTSEGEFVRSQIATNEPRYETIGLKRDGTRINIEVSAKACLYEGEPARLSAVREITERKRAEEQLRRQLDFTEAITSSLGEGLYALDKNGRVMFMNPAAEIGLGWKQEELLGQSMHEVIHFQRADGTPRSSEDCPLLGVLKSGQIVKVESDAFTRKDGTIFPVSYTSSPIITEGQVIGAVLAFHDVTERVELEEQFRQSQKMEAIGQLAGGVAHDFNNLLTAINGYSDLTLARLQAEDPLRRNLEEIRKAGDRAAALTRQLLAFSRKQVLQPKVFNLNSVVSDLERMLRRLIGEDIELRTVLESKLGSIKADPGQIEQIIMNLVVNARDALLQGGKLTIETKNVYLDDDYSKHHIAVVPGPFVMLAVSDTGIGMDEQTKARIFEPFFTTKLAGKGTGLGLSTVYGIVKQSGGNIWVYSEAGRGTTFKVYLPRVDEGAQEYKRSAETVEDLQGTGTILLAEDEEMVRTLARQVLEMYGYQVLEAANGGAALLICERHKEGIHLLLTDVVMPEMSGPELADRLAQLHPEMKVLFMSGYTDDTIVHQGVLDEGTPFIQKPFAPDDLARKVKEVLGRLS